MPVEQTRLMTRTDILITPHGAGVVNTFAMPPCSAVVELFPLGYVLPGLFGNLVAESGTLYYPWFSGSPSPRNGARYGVSSERVKGIPYEKGALSTGPSRASQPPHCVRTTSPPPPPPPPPPAPPPPPPLHPHHVHLPPPPPAKVTSLSRTAQQRSFNISVSEVHTLVLNAIAARAVCLSAAASPPGV